MDTAKLRAALALARGELDGATGLRVQLALASNAAQKAAFEARIRASEARLAALREQLIAAEAQAQV